MNRDTQLRVVLYGIIIFLAIATVWLGHRLYMLFIDIRHGHPNLGILGWLGILLWVLIGFAVMELTTRLCRRKKWSQNCYNEGVGAFGLYLMATSLIWLVVYG